MKIKATKSTLIILFNLISDFKNQYVELPLEHKNKDWGLKFKEWTRKTLEELSKEVKETVELLKKEQIKEYLEDKEKYEKDHGYNSDCGRAFLFNGLIGIQLLSEDKEYVEYLQEIENKYRNKFEEAIEYLNDEKDKTEIELPYLRSIHRPGSMDYVIEDLLIELALIKE